MSNEIIKIVKVEKLKNTYLVTTDHDEYKIDEDTIVKHFIVKDKEFTKAEFNRILKDIEINKAFNKAIKYLAYGERTTAEIRKYLKDDGHSEQVITRLKKIGYLDDNQYANKYLDYCYRNHKGPLYFKARLSEKGVDHKIIDEVMGKYTFAMQEEVVSAEVKKAVASKADLPVLAIKRQIMSKLLRNGFTSDVINNQLDHIVIEDQSEERLKKDYQKQLIKLENKDLSDYEKKQKIIAYLMNKGYEYQKIKEILE